MEIYPTLSSGMFSLIKDAQKRVHQPLSNTQECYLVTLLSESARQMQKDKHYEIAQLDHSHSVAVRFSDIMFYGEAASSSQFKRLGDSCLILSGMFYQNIQAKKISQDVYHAIGISSYSAAACLSSNKAWNSLLGEIAENFNLLTRVLRQITFNKFTKPI